MSQVKKKSSTRCLHSAAARQNHVRLYRHRVVATEPTRYTIVIDSLCTDTGTCLAGKVAYADRSELEAKGYTRATFDGEIEGSLTLFLTRSAAADAGLACPESVLLRSTILGEQPLGLKVLGHDLPDEQAYAACYAEVIREIPRRLFPASRGVWDLENGSVLVFGNDASPQDRRFEHEVEVFRRRMAEANMAEDFSFALSNDGGGWALVVYRGCYTPLTPEDSVRMNSMLWEAWIEACQLAQPRAPHGSASVSSSSEDGPGPFGDGASYVPR